MLAMSDGLFVLDFMIDGISAATVVSTGNSVLPTPPAGSLVSVGDDERKTFVVTDEKLHYHFTSTTVVVEVPVKAA